MKIFILIVAISVLVDFCLQQNVTENTTNTNSSQSTTNISNPTTSTVLTAQSNITTTTPKTTTQQYNITSTSAPVANTTEVSVNRELEAKRFTYNDDYCTCDLQESICDINCCCDKECRWVDKTIFSHCEEKTQRSYDTRFCEYTRYLYVNNTPTTWTVNQNGLFCVVSSNLPKSYIEQKPTMPLKSYHDSLQEKNKRFNWPKPPTSISSGFTSSVYLYDKDVWVVRNNMFITKLNVPQNLVTSACNTLTTISFLKNFANVCVQTSLNENNQYLNAETYFKNIKVIGVPNKFILSKYNKTFENCPKNICIEVTAKSCSANFEKCTNFSKEDKFVCNKGNSSFIPDCRNAVSKVFYKFYHNGTKGIIKTEVLFNLVNFTTMYPTLVNHQCFSQEFKVNFYWFNETTTNFSLARSGNPGYLVGKPILKGQHRNSSVWNLTRDSNDITSNFLTIAENVGGFCKLDNYTHILVEFGYNLASKCKILYVYKTSKTKNSTTAKNICQNLQSKIFSYWSIIQGVNSTYLNTSVGQWGNSNPKNRKDWVDLTYNKTPDFLINATKGEWRGKYNDSLVCFGLVLDLNIDIYHSRWQRNSLLNQERILAATFTFPQLVNLTIKEESHELEIRTFMMFYDITAPSKTKFVNPPSLDVKLPYDFFYPFVKIDNKSNVNLINLSVLLLGLIIFIL